MCADFYTEGCQMLPAGIEDIRIEAWSTRTIEEALENSINISSKPNSWTYWFRGWKRGRVAVLPALVYMSNIGCTINPNANQIGQQHQSLIDREWERRIVQFHRPKCLLVIFVIIFVSIHNTIVKLRLYFSIVDWLLLPTWFDRIGTDLHSD